MEIVNRAGFYTEMRRQHGLRVIGHCWRQGASQAEAPRLRCRGRKLSGAEPYITITGNPLPQTCPRMNIDGVIDAVVKELDGDR